MWTRHRGARENVIVDAVCCRYWRPCGQNVHSWCGYIRLHSFSLHELEFRVSCGKIIHIGKIPTLMMSGVITFGPLEEKTAIAGAGLIPTFVTVREILAVGFLELR
ncbi:hypothetical protein HanRHA438_Chr01g0030101 [Helianthus annuus]|nr:hypothetical protein HanRHA438_Chr01g0030101 [Helianthus annuus]